MKITIASYDEAHALLAASPTNFKHVVSINDPEQHPPETLTGHQARQLLLTFYDICDARAAHPNMPTRDHVEQLVWFARRIKQGDEVLVHCAAGISRSSAAALTILAHKERHKDLPAARRAIVGLLACKWLICPNPILVRHADDVLGFKGNLVQARGETFLPSGHIVLPAASKGRW